LSWKATVAYWALAAVFGAYYLAAEKRPAPKNEMQLARERVLNVYSDDIAAVTFRRDAREIRCELKDKRWKVVKPEGANLPPDLVAALVENLTDKQEAEEITKQPTPEEITTFGLDSNAPTVELESKQGTKYTVTLGARNPPQTAIYARTSVAPRVFLIGLNVQYYADLLYEAGAPKAAAASAPSAAKVTARTP
jgi:hypothetical protein